MAAAKPIAIMAQVEDSGMAAVAKPTVPFGPGQASPSNDRLPKPPSIRLADELVRVRSSL
jgi:hypothetical protein